MPRQEHFAVSFNDLQVPWCWHGLGIHGSLSKRQVLRTISKIINNKRHLKIIKNISFQKLVITQPSKYLPVQNETVETLEKDEK